MTDTPDAPPVPLRIVLDVLITPHPDEEGVDQLDFIGDRIMGEITKSGEVVEVRSLWVGPDGQPVGHIPWPRTPSEIEQAQNEQSHSQLIDEAYNAYMALGDDEWYALVAEVSRGALFPSSQHAAAFEQVIKIRKSGPPVPPGADVDMGAGQPPT